MAVVGGVMLQFVTGGSMGGGTTGPGCTDVVEQLAASTSAAMPPLMTAAHSSPRFIALTPLLWWR